jgi:hypothetical protein
MPGLRVHRRNEVDASACKRAWLMIAQTAGRRGQSFVIVSDAEHVSTVF